MTIEEELAAAKTKLAEFEAKGINTTALEEKIKGLSDTTTKLQAENQQILADNRKKDLDIAVRDALGEFPLAKDFKDLIRGDNAEAIKAAAKDIHEKQAKILEARGIKLKNNGLEEWAGVPSSVPSELLIANDREEQYSKVRGSKLPTRQKIAALMGMHIEDLYKKHVLDVRKRLGIR